MLVKVDHIDLRVTEFDETIAMFEKLGLAVKRSMPQRNSVEMALPGENQVVFEIHKVQDGAFTGIHHIAFKSEGENDDVECLKARGIEFKSEKKKIADTGRTVSSFSDGNGLTWQLTD